MQIVNEEIKIPISEFKEQKERRKRDKDKVFAGFIVFISGMSIFGIVLFHACEHVANKQRDEKIFMNMTACPKAIVNYTKGEPFVIFKGHKFMIEKEPCK
jgi:hypothetical protein